MLGLASVYYHFPLKIHLDVRNYCNFLLEFQYSEYITEISVEKCMSNHMDIIYNL